MKRITSPWRAARHELTHWKRLRRTLLRAELIWRGIPHAAGGDVVAVYADGLWFDVLAWHRDSDGFAWLVDHPHPILDEEYPGLEIGWRAGFRFHVDQLLTIWREYLADDSRSPWEALP